MENTNLETWPFLITRNKQLGYRPVVAPDFLVQTKSTFILSDAAGGDNTDPDYAIYRQIHSTDTGDLTIVFRVTDAVHNKELLCDTFGRRISWIAGLVFKGRVEELKVTKIQIEKVQDSVLEAFAQFWQAKVDFNTVPSQVLKFNAISLAGKTYELIRRKPHKVLFKQTIRWIKKHQMDIDKIVQSIVFNPASPLVAILLAKTQSLYLLNYSTKKTVGHFGLRNSSDFGAIRFTPDGNHLGIVDNSPTISIRTHNRVWLWNVKKQKNDSHTGKDKINRIWDIDFSPNGQFLACSGDEGYLYIWNVISREWIAAVLAHRELVVCTRFSHDSTVVATGGQNGIISFWRILENKLDPFVPNLKAHADTINQLEFSPKGHILASASDDHTIRLWDWQNNNEIAMLDKHSAAVNTISFSPDGRLLASAGKDQTIIIWDVYSQEVVSILESHRAEILTVAFSPDGSFILSGGVDKSLVWWEREN